jgi:putative Mg2+ transporter-C (MgtC) family protein
MMQELLSEFGEPLSAISWQVATLRIVFALFLGGIIGWEREMATKPAGLRTHMMVTAAACLFTLLAFELMEIDTADRDHVRTDPIRVIEAVTAGVAFLAAGSIFTSGDKVRGLTTGAGLWLGGAVGVACGLGRLTLALIATGATLLVLWLLRRVLASLLPEEHGDKDGRAGTRP